MIGSTFIDLLDRFEPDPETELVVLVGEIGGDEEEKAARHVAENLTTPVVAYIAGFSAPPGKTMGHAGAIISGSSGTAQAKKEALEAAGIHGRHDADRGGRARGRAARSAERLDSCDGVDLVRPRRARARVPPRRRARRLRALGARTRRQDDPLLRIGCRLCAAPRAARRVVQGAAGPDHPHERRAPGVRAPRPALRPRPDASSSKTRPTTGR